MTGSVALIVLAVLVVASLATVAGTATATPAAVSGSSGAGSVSTVSDGPPTEADVGAEAELVGSMGSTPMHTVGDSRHSSPSGPTPSRTAMDPVDGFNSVGDIPGQTHGASPTVVTSSTTVLDASGDHDAVGMEPTGIDGLVTRDVSGEPMDSGAQESSALHVEPAVGQGLTIDRSEQAVWPWGLAPDMPISPATAGGVAFGFLLGAGAYGVAGPTRTRPESVPESETGGTDADPEPAEGELADADLVPDEAVVEGMLLRQDGRMKQSAIVSMTDWSKAKVSRLLSTMAEDGRVVKVRMGRENLICLHGWEPDAVRSPYPG